MIIIKKIFSKWKEAIAGITLGIVLILGYQNINTAQRLALPVERFFEIKKLTISDFEEGALPSVSYIFHIKEPMFVQYTTQIVKVDETNTEPYFIKPIICQGVGTRTFEDVAVRESVGVSANWFIHSSCIIPPGEYKLMTTWNITVPGYPTKIYQKESNVFEVF